MSNIKMDKFYVYQPYSSKENGGHIYGVGCPSERFLKGIMTTISGLSKDEATKIVNLLNDHKWLVDTQSPSIIQQQLSAESNDSTLPNGNVR